MIPDITPILLSMVAINANRSNEDNTSNEKVNSCKDEDCEDEVSFIFKYLIRALRVTLIFVSLFLIVALISRFLL